MHASAGEGARGRVFRVKTPALMVERVSEGMSTEGCAAARRRSSSAIS